MLKSERQTIDIKDLHADLSGLQADLSGTKQRLTRVERVASLALVRENTKLWLHTSMKRFGPHIMEDLGMFSPSLNQQQKDLEFDAVFKVWAKDPGVYYEKRKKALYIKYSYTFMELKKVEAEIQRSNARNGSQRYRHQQNIKLGSLNKSASICREFCNTYIHTNGIPHNAVQSKEAVDFLRYALPPNVGEDMDLMNDLLDEGIPYQPLSPPK